MAKWVHDAERCDLFERIAASVWNRVGRAHSFNTDLKEIGITSDIIVDILEFNRTAYPNFKVYAQEGWQEKKYGSDMDVYVETNLNQYRWFALQAKILKKNNKYETLRDSSDNVKQWLKLRRLEKLSDCKAYYLLYNGKAVYTTKSNDMCDRDFNESQFGCSLIELDSIKRWVGSKSLGHRKKWIYVDPIFEDFHPRDAQPWRILTCCYHDKKAYKLYTIEEIVAANRNYEDLTRPLELEETKLDSNVDIPRDNRIINASNLADWTPGLRLVVRRTDNLEK